MERWVDIKNYEGIYQVSNFGRVRSLDRITTRYHKGRLVEQPLRGVFLSQGYSNSGGYPTVNLCKNGIGKMFYVHELVATHFIGPRPSPKHQICHRNGFVTDTREWNLRYDSPVGNALDRYEHGTDARGVNNPMAKLSIEQVTEIKKLLKAKSIKEVSELTGVNYSTVRCIKQGRNWGWLEV